MRRLQSRYHRAPAARVAKLVDAQDLKSWAERRVGSIPAPGTSVANRRISAPPAGFARGPKVWRAFLQKSVSAFLLFVFPELRGDHVSTQLIALTEQRLV